MPALLAGVPIFALPAVAPVSPRDRSKPTAARAPVRLRRGVPARAVKIVIRRITAGSALVPRASHYWAEGLRRCADKQSGVFDADNAAPSRIFGGPVGTDVPPTSASWRRVGRAAEDDQYPPPAAVSLESGKSLLLRGWTPAPPGEMAAPSNRVCSHLLSDSVWGRRTLKYSLDAFKLRAMHRARQYGRDETTPFGVVAPGQGWGVVLALQRSTQAWKTSAAPFSIFTPTHLSCLGG